jgi:hypothetical protein
MTCCSQLGDLSRDGMRARTSSGDVASTIGQLVDSARAISIRIAGCEDAERYMPSGTARYRARAALSCRAEFETRVSPARDP